MAARVGFEPVTLPTQGTEPTTEQPHPTILLSSTWTGAGQLGTGHLGTERLDPATSQSLDYPASN